MNKWYDALIGKSNYEAFRIIWDPKRDLTIKQKKTLVEYHREINDKAVYDKWSKPEAWADNGGSDGGDRRNTETAEDTATDTVA
jgi:hypothetical protein